MKLAVEWSCSSQKSGICSVFSFMACGLRVLSSVLNFLCFGAFFCTEFSFLLLDSVLANRQSERPPYCGVVALMHRTAVLLLKMQTRRTAALLSCTASTIVLLQRRTLRWLGSDPISNEEAPQCIQSQRRRSAFRGASALLIRGTSVLADVGVGVAFKGGQSESESNDNHVQHLQLLCPPHIPIYKPQCAKLCTPFICCAICQNFAFVVALLPSRLNCTLQCFCRLLCRFRKLFLTVYILKWIELLLGWWIDC